MKYGRITATEAYEKGLVPAKVELDGVEICNVSTVDDVEGWIDVYVTDSKGMIAAFKNPSTGEIETRTYRLIGEVTYTPNIDKGE